jgi:hypothetical protein
MSRSNSPSRIAQEVVKANVSRIRPLIDSFLRESVVSVVFSAPSRGAPVHHHVEARRPGSDRGVVVHQWNTHGPNGLMGAIAFYDPATSTLVHQLLPGPDLPKTFGFPSIPSIGDCLWNKVLDAPYREFVERIRDLTSDGRSACVDSARRSMVAAVRMMVLAGMSRESVLADVGDAADSAITEKVLSS